MEQADSGAIDQFLYNNIEHPYATRMLGNEGNTNEQERDSEDDSEDDEGYTGEDGGVRALYM